MSIPTIDEIDAPPIAWPLHTPPPPRAALCQDDQGMIQPIYDRHRAAWTQRPKKRPPHTAR